MTHRLLGFAAWIVGSLILGCLPASAGTILKQIPTQYIAALGDKTATHGAGAELWGLWPLDPGPRGVHLVDFPSLSKTGTAPAAWRFEPEDWWLEEHGLIMEAPQFPLPAGRYVVTGARSTVAILTIHDRNAAGAQTWDLSDGATLYDVTHLRCRAARYSPERAGGNCTPANVAGEQFPVVPGAAMPEAPHCAKQDYQVLIVIGMAVEQ